MKKYILPYFRITSYLLAVAVILMLSQCKKSASLNAVIISDQNSETSESVENILINTGLFDADIESSDFTGFHNYDLVVFNTSTANWSEDIKNKFATYVKNGGGMVVLNIAANAFSDWGTFSQMSGVKAGSAKSDVAYEFEVMASNVQHPIIKDLQNNWLHTSDFLLFNSKSLDGDVEVLATAKADTLHGGDGGILPVLVTVKFGEGRIFTSMLGADASAMQCVGFITTLQRGAEWAATGVVSQVVPVDFPNAVSTHQWPNYRPLTLEEILQYAATYEVGKSKKYLTDFTMHIRNSDGKPETYAMYEDKILDFLQSDATVDSKKYLCKELSWMGSDKSLPVLDNLINDKDLSDAASYALQRLRM